MSVSIGGVSFNKLTAQPFGYDETDTRRGFTAKKWLVNGLLTPAEWVSLLSVYDGWRNSKISEEDPLVSNTVGTTVNLSGTGAGGVSWNVGCWFSTAPQGEQSGRYISVSVELVHAAEALAVLVASQEAEQQSNDLAPPDLGSININGATITLTKPPDTFQSPPSLQLSASGKSYLQGPLVAVEVQDIEGETNAAGWAAIRQWFASTVATTPGANSWYPTSSPTASAERRLVNGTETTVYIVSLQRTKVI